MGGVTRLILAIATMGASVLFVCEKSYAIDPFGEFDPEYYKNKYPDVVEEFGEDYNCLYSHYLDIGKKEGRYPNKEVELKENAGDTYIDIDLEKQRVIYYVDGTALIETDCVSGDVDGGRPTPKGTYQILTKTNGKYLKGPTWNCWVDYWMRITETNIGLHDASWRSKFGGEIYKTGGSHGCVNLPCEDAKSLYELVSVGTTVIVH